MGFLSRYSRIIRIASRGFPLAHSASASSYSASVVPGAFSDKSTSPVRRENHRATSQPTNPAKPRSDATNPPIQRKLRLLSGALALEPDPPGVVFVLAAPTPLLMAFVVMMPVAALVVVRRESGMGSAAGSGANSEASSPARFTSTAEKLERNRWRHSEANRNNDRAAIPLIQVVISRPVLPPHRRFEKGKAFPTSHPQAILTLPA